MKSILITFAFIAVTMANPFADARNNVLVRYRNGRMECRSACGRRFENCPQVPCEQPPLDRTCPAPNCSSGRSRQFLFAHADPRRYYQCAPNFVNGNYVFEVLVRDCGCQTYFDYAKQACVHPSDWSSQCNATSNPPPAPNVCPVECLTC